MHIKVNNWSNDPEEVEIDREPDRCPICHSSVQPIRTQLAFKPKEGLSDAELEIVFRCPSRKCGRYFVARYSPRYDAVASYIPVLTLYGCYPWQVIWPEVDPTVADISPSFSSIWKEAQVADQFNLKLACGPAYRKALEFLIKDYAIRLRPSEAEKIKAMQLGSCIQTYIADSNVKATAKRAAWLGNDETHYSRKWEDKDLADLKTLIQVTVHWIQLEELTKQALQSMPDDPK